MLHFKLTAGKTPFLFAILLASGLTSSRAQNTWEQKTDFGGTARSGAVGFSIGTKGYLGTGGDVLSYKDFWEYDPALDTWTQKADFAGTARAGAVGFSIGSKGYLGTGYDGIAPTYYTEDFWEYDPDANTWTQKADFGGTARLRTVGFSIGSKGYLGTGHDINSAQKDFWEYDPDTDTWAQKADFGGTARNGAVGFSIGSKGYLGTGDDGTSTKDFWEYDPALDTWTQKADFGGTARNGAVGFSIGSKGYLGTGYDGGYKKDFWEYDPDADTWTQIADFGGTARNGAVGFSSSSKGYLGTGNDNNSAYKDFWEYTPELGVGISSIENSEFTLSVFPNPTDGAFVTYLKLNNELNAEAMFEVINILGQKVYSQKVQIVKGVLLKEIQVSDAAAEGIYVVKAIVNDRAYSTQINLRK